MGRQSDARERIVEAATGLFHERGYHAVGVNEICRRSDVQKGSFYHFFDSKRALALAVIEAHQDAEAAEMARVLADGGPPLERLDRLFHGLHSRQAGECAEGSTVLGCPLGNLALELATYDEQLRAALRRAFDRQVDAFERVLAEAVRRGDLPASTDAAATAQALVALLEGTLLFAKLANDAAPLADLAANARRVLGLSA